MKSCPICQRVFPNDAGFCPADGTPLTTASMAPIAPSADDPRIGARLCGRYEIRRVVADGGMGRVYEGIDKQTDSRIALKVLHEDVAKDDVALERFKREYEISALLPHEHIVRVLDFQRDVAQKTWLLVMEFLDGEELRYVLKRERVLPPERLVRMLSQVAIGLDRAHARSFIHRDLKPDNLFLCGTREGDIVKVLDFGSVKDRSGNRKKLTVLGTTIGSPYYMSPEQAQGLDTIDARADVFALAAVTYECVTGEVPFAGNNGPSILLAIMTKDPVPPSVKARGAKHAVPLALDEVIEVALAKNQNVRTSSVGALAEAVGHAYGLSGDHLQWATLPQSELARRIAEAPRPMAPEVAPLDVAADPFAAPPRGAEDFGAPAPQPQRAFQQAPHGDALAATMSDADLAPHGVPARKPGWLLPVVVGVLALVVGGAVTLVVMAGR
jgi:serine/threonine protein kinase